MRSRTVRAAGEGRARLGLSGRATLEDGVPGVHGIELVCGLEKYVRERLDGLRRYGMAGTRCGCGWGPCLG